MTYSSGGLIQATDYNGFVSTTVAANVNATWNTTYGQTALATVSSGGTVSATQWASLVNTISSMASHTGTTVTARTAPVAGNTINVFAALNTDLTNITTNRGNAAASGTTSTVFSGTTSKTTATQGAQFLAGDQQLVARLCQVAPGFGFALQGIQHIGLGAAARQNALAA
jgi:hypothetical protein